MKKIFFLAATAAVAMSSCSKNEVSEIANPNDNPNTIGLSVGTFASKSAVTETDDLEDSDDVTLYSTETKLNGLKFVYDTEWAQAANGTANWQGITFGTGIPVYSAHNGTASVPVTAAATGTLASAFAVDTDVTDQVDLVYFAQNLSAIPTDGKISAVFNHALSRVKMEETTDDTKMTTDVTGVKLIGFDGSATPTLDPTDNTIDWSAVAVADQTESYAYNLAGATDTDNDMYIIPQTSKVFTYDADNLDAPESGVEALCITTINGTPLAQRAGFVSIAAFIAANPGVKTVTVDGTVVTDATTLANTKMYVKAIFPLNAQQFADAKYYNLQLNFAGAGIYYKDGKYYTADDKVIEITFEDGKTPTTPQPEEGKPINPSTTDLIGLTVQVSEWPAAPSEDKDLAPNK